MSLYCLFSCLCCCFKSPCDLFFCSCVSLWWFCNPLWSLWFFDFSTTKTVALVLVPWQGLQGVLSPLAPVWSPVPFEQTVSKTIQSQSTCLIIYAVTVWFPFSPNTSLPVGWVSSSISSILLSLLLSSPDIKCTGHACVSPSHHVNAHGHVLQEETLISVDPYHWCCTPYKMHSFFFFSRLPKGPGQSCQTGIANVVRTVTDSSSLFRALGRQELALMTVIKVCIIFCSIRL